MPDELDVDRSLHGKRRTRGSGGRGAAGGRPKPWVDRAIVELAETQHGIVARRQLLDLGIGPGRIDGRLSRGQLHLLHRGVYGVGHGRLDQMARWMAAVLSSEPAAILSHRSAGQLWQILPRAGTVPEVIRPKSSRGNPRLVAHQSILAVDEVEEVDGIPVTSVSRTLLDLAAVLSRRKLEQALNEAEVRRLTSLVSLPELLRRHPGRRGAVALKELSDSGPGGITRSELEARFAALIEVHRLPRPRRNAHLAVRGRFFEVDCLWESARLVVELDGHAVHGTMGAFEADRERDRLLVGEGWGVVRLTWRQVRDEGPSIAADLRELLVPTL